MFFQFSSLVAVTHTLAFLVSTSVAGHIHRHHARHAFQDGSLKIQRDGGSVQVPVNYLQLLQLEHTTFQQWMKTWLDAVQDVDEASATDLLRQELQAYNGWITAWLDSANAVGGPPPPPLPSSIPVTLPVTRAKSSPVLSVVSVQTTTVISVAPAVASSASNTSSAISVVPQAGEFYQRLTHSPLSTSSIAASAELSQTSFLTLTSQKPIQTSLPAPLILTSQKSIQTSLSAPLILTSQKSIETSLSAPLILTSTPALSLTPIITSKPALTSAPAVVTPVISSTQPATPDAGPPPLGGSNKVAVYYGQTPATAQTSLAQVCQRSEVDIVILSFLTEFFGPGGFPALNFGSACGGQTPQMQSAGASKLLSCPDMASQIKQCQSLGKIVLLSLGGSIATSAFSDASKATSFANQLWDLFGAGTGVSPGLRPFGDVRLDGFDVDNEDHSTANYNTFVSALRSAMNKDSSRKYFISAAPQCPRPDESIPLDAMQQMDFVFVQFYNNAAANCNVGQPGFLDSFKAWSSDLASNGGGPKLYVGAPGCPACAGAGYLDTPALAAAVQQAKSAGVSNFGGFMLWDGPEAMANTQGGKDYLTSLKNALAY